MIIGYVLAFTIVGLCAAAAGVGVVGAIKAEIAYRKGQRALEDILKGRHIDEDLR